MTHAVTFEPLGATVQVEQGATLLEAARAAGVPMGAVCGGAGTCGKCRVRITSGPVPRPSPADKRILPPGLLEQGDRLACSTGVTAPMVVEALFVSSHGKEEQPISAQTSPGAQPVRRFVVAVSEPTLEKPRADAESLFAALAGAGVGVAGGIDYPVIQELPRLLRSSGWRVAASLRHGEVIAVRPAEDAPCPLGAAVDLGTTTIALYLHRLDTGLLLGVLTAANPLASYGADIITRMSHAEKAPGNGARLQRILAAAVNLLAKRAAQARGCSNEDIEEMVVVGNTGMHHLFLGLPCRQLMNAPYVPSLREAVSVKARDLGLGISRGGYAYFPPLVGGFIGSDLLAMALATGMDRAPGIRLALDIGTNTEVLLSVDGSLSSCSTASGPALEGGALAFGTTAVPGAIDSVGLPEEGDGLACRTIGGGPAVGICGSGIIDALFALRQLGIISPSGRIQAGSPGVLPSPEGDHRYVLLPAARNALGVDLTLSQEEIRSIQLAKGAIRAGIDTLLADQGVQPDRIQQIEVAGAFGSHIDITSALGIGLLPPVPPERIRQVGNAAGVGAGLMLLSESERERAAALSARIRCTELALQKGFLRRFARAQAFAAREE